VWKEVENAKDFVNHITELAADLCLLGDNVIDNEVVGNMQQRVVEQRYKRVVEHLCMVVALYSSECRLLRVVKGKVFAQLDGEMEHDDNLWYLDSGATNHMLGCRDSFIDIDMVIHDTIKFGNDLEVAIEGSSTMLFESKTGEHLSLMGVYFIPRLTTNIINLGQLDEGGCDVHTKHDILWIHNDKGCLITRV
jgi:hypothetical protein